MADVFVSYSRRDTEFVTRLVAALEAQRDVWLDVEGIADAEVFPDALRAAIDGASGFVFVISPDSAASPYCAQEIEQALAAGKRIVPLVHREVADADLPDAIRVRNWIRFDGDEPFDRSVARVAAALDHDLAHAKAHTAWGLKAREWDESTRDKAFLLRGSELNTAEAWLTGAAGKDPAPTDLHTAFVTASRSAAARRGRVVTGISLAVTAAALVLVVVALVSRHQAQRDRAAAVKARSVATSRQLAAQADAQRSADPELAVLLARRGLQTAVTPDAVRALRDALDASPVRARLPPTGEQGCPQAHTLVYAPSGKQLIQGQCRGIVRLVDTATQRVVRSRKVATTLSQMALSPDGRRLAVAIPDAVLVLDATTLRTTRTLRGGAKFGPTIADDGHVAAATARGVRVWDPGSDVGRMLRSAGGPPVTVARYVDAGRTLLIGRDFSLVQGAARDALQLVDARADRVLHSTAPRKYVADIAVRPDGREAAVSFIDPAVRGPDNAVGRFRIADLTPRPGLIRSPASPVSALAYSPDGARLVLGQANGDMTIDDARTGDTVLRLDGQTVNVSSVAFSPDGRQVASYPDDGDARLWDAREGDPIFARATGPVYEIAFAGRGRLWATTDANDALSWDVRTRRSLGRLSYDVPPEFGSALGLGIEGRTLYAPTPALDGSYLVKALPGNRTIGTIDPRPYYPYGLFTRPGSRQIAMPRVDPKSSGLIRPALFDLHGGRKVAELDGPVPECVNGWGWGKWSADGGTFAAGTACGQVIVWDADTRKQAWRTSIEGSASSEAISPDGKTLVVGGADSTITIFSLAERRRLRVLAGHERGVTAVAFSPDGRQLVSAGNDQTIKVFDTASWNLLRVIRRTARADPDAIVLSPDGRRIFAADQQGVIRSYALCPNCGDAEALLREAGEQTTRDFTASERSAFLGDA